MTASYPCDSGFATKQAKIDYIKQDFLERDGTRFVKVCRNGRLDWESTLPKEGAYSDFVLKTTDDEELMHEAYRMASDMVKVMDADREIKISVGETQASATDGNTVWVETAFFDDKSMTNGRKMDVFVGLTVHECCHVLWTDFKDLKGVKGITKDLWNIIEDERIERKCCENKPGLSNFLGATKNYKFDAAAYGLEHEMPKAEMNELRDVINTILAYIRYPKALKEEFIDKYCDILIGVRRILTPYPESSAESVLAAEKITQLLEKFVNDQNKNTGSGNAGNDKKNDSQEDKSQDGPSSSGPSDSSDNQSSVDAGQPEPQDDNPQEYNPQDASSVLDTMSKLMHIKALTSESKNNADMLAATVHNESKRKYIEGRNEKGMLKGSYIEKASSNEEVYRECRDRIKPLVASIRRAVTCSTTRYTDSLHGCRSGKLDPGRIAEAFQGVQTVHLRQCEVKADNIAVAVLIDESGSMWGGGEEAARDTAVLLNEALTGIPGIDLYIYGHTASKDITRLFVYRERGFVSKWALGSTDSRAGNHDSIAIREVAHRVRRFTSDKCLLFVISDGAPNEETAVVKKAVQDVEKDGFPVLAISIDPYYDPATMYEHNITLSDLPSLAKELGKIVKKAVMDNAKRSVHTF